MISRRAVIGVLAAGLVLAGGATYHCGTLLARPVQRQVGPAPSDLPLVDVELHGQSGQRLRGWLARGVRGQGAIVLLHGVRGDRRSMLERARFLYAHGYSVFLLDLQAHGESDGEKITFGLLEGRGVRVAVDFLRKELPGESVGALGTSLGGAACLLGGDPLDVDALVLEAVYPDVIPAIRNRLRIRFGEPGGWLTPLLVFQIKPRLGIDPKLLRPIDRVAELQAPVLIIAGENDRRTTLAESTAMYAAAPDPKELWTVPGASHIDFYRHNESEYEARVLDFFQRHMRGRNT